MTIDVRSLGPQRVKKMRAVGWLLANLEAAERVVRGEGTSPVPRDKLATLFRQFVAMFDREKAWDEVDQGDVIRRRTLLVCDALDAQARRTCGL